MPFLAKSMAVNSQSSMARISSDRAANRPAWSVDVRCPCGLGGTGEREASAASPASLPGPGRSAMICVSCP